MSVPAWVKDAVFYQIFPDRFENGDDRNDPPNKAAWGKHPTPFTFFGGDLQGIIQRLDHLTELGINAIYLNPIFESPSTHRYNTTDYYRIDRKLGTMEDWRALVEAAHRRGIRLVLDGVFNHCGRGFFAFNDILENGEFSPYRDWFHIKHFPVDAYSLGDAHDYVGWWRHKSLPKLNTSNVEVRQFLLDVSRYWIEQGADGWRLDVPNEIDDDDFWAEFRQVVKTANPEAYLVGEIWDVVPRWVGENHFDGLMNYPLRNAVLELLSGHIKASAFADQVEQLLTVYPPSMYMLN
jgi:cyclomaltodextrinase / maltogenic alpha-amylase / neopullulanase